MLRDLVLFGRPERDGGPFLFDRFETTQADWLAWLRAADRTLTHLRSFDSFNGQEDPLLPVVGIDLPEARAFARWRFGRLPRFDEWRFSATAGGRYRLPWGDVERDVWTNSAGLGLGEVVPVGCFESGRQRDGCYDLVGNAAEWSESVARGVVAAASVGYVSAAWDQGAPDLVRRLSRLDRHPALWGWRLSGAAWSSTMIVATDSATAARWCAPGFDRSMVGGSVLNTGVAMLMRPGERSSRLGLRVATDPRTLLARLLELSGRVTPAEEAALRKFLRRADLRGLLRAAAAGIDGFDLDTPIARILRAELGW